MNKGSKTLALSLTIPIAVLILWYITTTYGSVPSAILPTIKKVLLSFRETIFSGQLASDVGITIVRVLKGYIIAAVVGIFLGASMGMSRVVDSIFSLTLNTIRQIPMLAWIPLIILWFGIEEASKIVIIVLGAFFPIMMNTMNAIRQTPREYIEVAKLYRLNKWDTFKKVYLPSAIPQIFVGLKIGLGISWMAVVAAEMMAGSSGLGFRISDGRTLMQPDVVIIGMIVIGFVGIMMDKILTWISKKATPWARTN